MTSAPASQFESTVVEHLLHYGIRRFYPAGSCLFHQGDPAGNVLLVESGTVRVERTDSDEQNLIELAGPSTIIGDLGVIDDQPRATTASAATDTTVLRVSAEQFHTIFRCNPDLHRSLLVRSMRRMRQLYEPTAA